jgi:glycosyltransferase involved in cell wall biosynthesis
MRILLVTSMAPDPRGIGAIPKLLHAQLLGLQERGHGLTLVAPYGEDPGQAEAAAALSADPSLDAHLVDRRRSPHRGRRWRVRAELMGNWARHDWPWRVVLGATGLQPLIDELTARERFDVVAVEDNPVAVLRFPTSLPSVLTEHEAVRAPASDRGVAPYPSLGGKRRHAAQLRERAAAALHQRDWDRWDSFLPAAWGRFDLLQVFSEGDAAAVRSRAPDLNSRLRLNPYGMVLPAALDPAAEEEDTLLFTGTFAHLPNRDAARWLAAEIMPAVRRQRPDALLRIVGHRPPPEVLGLAGPGVEVIADAPSVEPYLAAAAVVIAPVRSGGGMRMKVLEALAKGKAVVTTPLGAEGFTAFGTEPPLAIAADGAGLAAATAELLAEPARRRRLGTEARAFAEAHHSPAAWAERLEAIYSEAATAHRASSPATSGQLGGTSDR